MKNFLNKVLLIVGMLFATVISSQASTISPYIAAQTTNGASVFSNGTVIYKLTFFNTNNTAGPNTIYFFDSGNTATNGNTNINFVALAYTNATLVATNHRVLFTNILGATEDYTNSTYIWSNTVVAAALTQKPVLFNISVPAGTNTFVYQPVYPIQAFQGVVVTNLFGLTIAIDYAPLR